MKLSVKAGTTSKTINIFIQDSSSTTGAGLTGLVFNSSGLTAYYALQRATAVSITLATQTVTGAYSSGGFVEISSANMPGWYRFDIPDAALASGTFTSIHFKGATNQAPLPLEIELTAVDNQDSAAFGLSRIDGTITSRMATYSQPTGFLAATFPSGTVANTTNITAGTITTVTNLTNAPTAGDFTATMKTSVTTAATAATPTAAAVTGAVGSVTGNVGGSVASVTAVSSGAITSGSFAAGAIDAAAIAANAIGSSEFAQTARDAVSDALLARNIAGGSSSGRIVSDAMALLRNKVDIAAGTMTCYATDDTTPLWTAAITTTAGNPITTVDPA